MEKTILPFALGVELGVVILLAKVDGFSTFLNFIINSFYDTMYYQETFKLYYDYCINYKLFDKAFIKKIIPILVFNKKLSDYVSDFHISNEKISTIGGITSASYNAYDKKINI